MSGPVRIGVLGLTHDHIWDNLPQARDHSEVRLVAGADPHQALLGRIESEYRCRPYTNYETLLNSEDLDAVWVYGDNALGVELAESALQRDLHVLIEKPMAADQRGAERMLAAAQQSKGNLMVNWPFAWWPQLQHAIRLAREGAVGKIWQVRYRAAHAGPRELGCSEYFCDWLFDPARNGAGGAYLDYCCYGAVLARVLMGVPERVTGHAARFVKQDITVEDNAILIMHYPNGMAVSEGSWTQIGKLSAYTTLIYGDQGTLMVEPRAGGKLWLATPDDEAGSAVDVPPPAAGFRSATDHFVAALRGEVECQELCEPSACCDAQKILEAGIRAHSQNQTVSVD